MSLDAALAEAKKSEKKKEVPVGAVIVKDGKIIARAHNLKESRKDTTAHAELLAIQKAQKKIKDWRLDGCILYSTLEPCPMCAGAILHARIKTVIFGAKDLKWGAAGTKTNLFSEKLFNHFTQIIYVPTKSCEKILTNFFRSLR